MGFSWKRALGLSAAKGKVSRAIGVPLTASGRQKNAKKVLGPLAPLLGTKKRKKSGL